MKVKIETTSGTTTIELEHVCAISEVRTKSFATAPVYTLDIHMINGTIFTTTTTEAEKVIIYNSWGVE